MKPVLLSYNQPDTSWSQSLLACQMSSEEVLVYLHNYFQPHLATYSGFVIKMLSVTGKSPEDKSLQGSLMQWNAVQRLLPLYQKGWI